jgi:predicted nuclease of predicted toxin-antitoxin system
MPETIRFHMDEHVPSAIAEALRRQGIDVTTTLESGLVSADDPEQLAFATSEVRVLFTQDRDFLVLNASGHPHSGIAYCRQESRSIGEIVRALCLIWAVYEPQEMANRVEYL